MYVHDNALLYSPMSFSLSLSYAEWFINTGGDLVQKEHWFGRSARQEETVQAIGTIRNKEQATKHYFTFRFNERAFRDIIQ